MNTNRRSSIYLPMAAMILSAALALPAAAGTEVPFSGALQGREIDVPQGGPPPTTLAVDGSATGIATQLGQYTVTWKLTVDLSNGSATGTFHFTAANGDSIDTTVVGQGTPTDTPGLNRIVEINTITGGTGRFAGAHGTFTLERLVDLNTGITSGWFHGTLTSPGSAHLNQVRRKTIGRG